jgi:hypothetical protein
MKRSFILYNDQKDVFEELNPKECKELLLAIFDYSAGVETKLSPVVRVAFISIKNQLKRDISKWHSNSEMRKQFGRLGGLAKASKSQLKPVLLSKSTVNVNVNDNVNGNVTITGKTQERHSSYKETSPAGSEKEAWDVASTFTQLSKDRGAAR